MYRKLLLIALSAFAAASLYSQNPTAGSNTAYDRNVRYNELGDTPQMGWNSWNKFACDIDEDVIKMMADVMADGGFLEAGYEYLNLDDCWHGMRDENGFIQCDPVKFPSGMKALVDYIHSRGLKVGIYSDAGWHTCGGREGSLGHEFQDAIQYANWGIDYLKYDWCESNGLNAKTAYTLMSRALKATGRPIFFSMCEWGSNKPWEWGNEVANSWRTTGDISAHFTRDGKYPSYSLCILDILDMQAGLRKYAGPGHWNDPDMLEVGNGMSVAEDRAHFTLWAMLCAPLLMGNDLVHMSQETRAILLNKEVIALNQDPLGVQALKYKTEQDGALEFWFKPLEDGDWAVCIFNRSEQDREYLIDWRNFCFTDTEVSNLSTSFDTVVYRIKNLWTGKEEGTTALPKNYNKMKTVKVPSHDVVLYRLSPVSE